MFFTLATVVAYVIGGAMIAAESVEEENKRRQALLDRCRAEVEAESRRQAEELRRLALLTNIGEKMQAYQVFLLSARKAEKLYYSKCCEAKRQMRSLKQQRKRVRRNCWAVGVVLAKYKKRKSHFLWIFPRKVDFTKDTFVIEKNKTLKQLRGFQQTVGAQIQQFSKEKDKLYQSMRVMNRQAQEAQRQFDSFRREKVSFTCEKCGCSFSASNATVAACQRKGKRFQYLCPRCRKRPALTCV